jgi:hypothetical protein
MKRLQHGSQGGAHADQDQSRSCILSVLDTRRSGKALCPGVVLQDGNRHGGGGALEYGTWAPRPRGECLQWQDAEPISSRDISEDLHIFMRVIRLEDAEPSSITNFWRSVMPCSVVQDHGKKRHLVKHPLKLICFHARV